MLVKATPPTAFRKQHSQLAALFHAPIQNWRKKLKDHFSQDGNRRKHASLEKIEQYVVRATPDWNIPTLSKQRESRS